MQVDISTHWGNLRVILGSYGDNGKENGNCASRWLRRRKERAGKHPGAHYIVGGLYRL